MGHLEDNRLTTGTPRTAKIFRDGRMIDQGTVLTLDDDGRGWWGLELQGNDGYRYYKSIDGLSYEVIQCS